ncbi:MAG: hypothetical protein U1E59_15710 [Amaricoccus sp.]
MAGGDEIVLELARPEAMFETPPEEPLAPGFALERGIDRVFEAVGALTARQRAAARLTVQVPAGTEEAAGRIEPGVRRYCAVRREDNRLRQAALRREGLQTLALAAGFILACLLLAAVIEVLPGEGGLLRGLLRDGLVVAGWVALWRPLDLLLYDTWLLRREGRILEAVAAMPIRVAAG